MSKAKRAAFYARRGWSVFPLYTIEDDGCSCRRPDCSSPGKHPIGFLAPQGVLNATSDERAVLEWWTSYPDANVGIATGDASAIVVLDIDGDQGRTTMANLAAKGYDLPPTWTVETGGGGLHCYFAMPPIAVRNSASAIGPGVDVRGNGGYVVAPPSDHLSGTRYCWSTVLHPQRVLLSDLPDWLLNRMVPAAVRANASPPLPRAISEGQRNSLLASAAGSMRRRGFSEDAIRAALLIENRLRCRPPLPDREVERIARSIDRYPPAPRIWAGDVVVTA